jgi:hypothetical protein
MTGKSDDFRILEVTFRAAVNPSLDGADKASLLCTPRHVTLRIPPSPALLSRGKGGCRSWGNCHRMWQRMKSVRVRSDVFSTRYRISSTRSNAGLWKVRQGRSEAGAEA